MTTGSLWRCPVCGRLLSKPNQWHSHLSQSVDAHFQGKSDQKALFDALLAKLEDFGPVRVDAVKTSINLIANHHFGAVTVLKEGLRLGFVVHRPLASPRILRTEPLGGNKYGYTVKLNNVADIDAELLAWLKEAYDQAA